MDSRLPGLVLAGAALGSAAGLAHGLMTVAENDYMDQGLGFVAARTVATVVLRWTLMGGAVALAWIVGSLAAWPVARLVRGAGRPALVGAALAPPVAAGWAVLGLWLNREHLPGFLDPKSLLANAGLTLAALVLWFLLSVMVNGLVPEGGRGPRIPAWALLVVSLVAVGATQVVRLVAAPAVDAPRPNVLIVLVDALRADRLSSYGHDRPTTPHIDSVASEGWRFEEAVSVTSWTKPAVATLFTSRWPAEIGIETGSWSKADESGRVRVSTLSRSLVTLAELMGNAGYETAGFGKNHHLTPQLGFDQGFETYVMDLEDEEDPELSAGSIRNRFLGWLDDEPGDFFAYLHYIDVHWPYAPPEPFLGRYAGPAPELDYNAGEFMDWADEERARGPLDLDEHVVRHMSDAYDEGIAFVDEQIGVIVQELKQRGLWDDTLVIITSDHGDEFMEHGAINHGASLHDELLRVPLVVKFPCPGKNCGPRVVESQVGLIDLMPTILARAGIDPREGMRGLDLATLGDMRRPAFAELGDTVALRTTRFKYLLNRSTGLEQLYDLEADPGELENLAELHPEITAPLREQLETWVARVESGAIEGEEQVLDEEALEKLRALGYME